MKSVAILLAVYKPNLVFLRDLLRSIESQDYSNISVQIRDDSGDDSYKKVILKTANECLKEKNFNYKLNKANYGSNKTFELLTKEANADFVAYCDQDDVWQPEKISTLINKIHQEGSVIAYSDLSLIDKNGIELGDSFKNYSKRIKHVKGNNLTSFFLNRNSITGCTMLIKTNVAKQALPFPSSEIYVHDHWLALVASTVGKISYVEAPLVKYRLHEDNQIGANILDSIFSKNDYIKIKLKKDLDRLQIIETRFDSKYQRDFLQHKNYVLLRHKQLTKKSVINSIKLLRHIRKDFSLVSFELMINWVPEKYTVKIISKIK